jgi:hypothetical protein
VEVVCITAIEGRNRRRNVISRAFLDKTMFREFPFGTFMPIEEFIIRLRTQFVQEPNVADLLSYVSGVSSNSELRQDDDGVGQSVSVKKGVSGAVKKIQNVPAEHELMPYRTFREISQPSGNFLLRMRESGGLGRSKLYRII